MSFLKRKDTDLCMLGSQRAAFACREHLALANGMEFNAVCEALKKVKKKNTLTVLKCVDN